MRYERLAEITMKFKDVLNECEEELWGCARELGLTPSERQELRMERYEALPYEGYGQYARNGTAVWDNLGSRYVEEGGHVLIFDEDSTAREEARALNERELGTSMADPIEGTAG